MEATLRETIGSGPSTHWPDQVRVRPVSSAQPLSEPRVLPDRALLDLTAHGEACGGGQWCQKCRREIQQEALRWIQELNAPITWESATSPIPHRTWHQELLLGNTT